MKQFITLIDDSGDKVTININRIDYIDHESDTIMFNNNVVYLHDGQLKKLLQYLSKDLEIVKDIT